MKLPVKFRTKKADQESKDEELRKEILELKAEYEQLRDALLKEIEARKKQRSKKKEEQ